MKAKYPGACKVCKGRIVAGAEIRMSEAGAVHGGCFHIAVISGARSIRKGSDDGYDGLRDAYLTGESGYDPRGR